MKIQAVAIAALLFGSTLAAESQNSSLLRKAHEAYTLAQSLEAQLNEKPETDRARTDYLKVISAFERVYLITPHTPFADNSLMAIAKLYEEIQSGRHQNAEILDTRVPYQPVQRGRRKGYCATERSKGPEGNFCREDSFG